MKNIMLCLLIAALSFAGCKKETTEDLITRQWTAVSATLDGNSFPEFKNSTLTLNDSGDFTFYTAYDGNTLSGLWQLQNNDKALKLNYDSGTSETFTIAKLNDILLNLEANLSDGAGNTVYAKMYFK